MIGGGDRCAIGHFAGEIVALPAFFDRVLILLFETFIEIVARLAPGGEFFIELRVCADRFFDRLELVDLFMLDRQDKAKRLALFEFDDPGPCHDPVHGERKGQPVGLDQSGQGRNPVLDMVRRAARPNRPTRRGPEQIAGVKGHNAARKMRGDEVFDVVIHIIGIDDDIGLIRPAIPFNGDVGRTENLPTGGIGHDQGQTPIRKAGIKRVHPFPVRRPRDQFGRRVFVDQIALQLHGPV